MAVRPGRPHHLQLTAKTAPRPLPWPQGRAHGRAWRTLAIRWILAVWSTTAATMAKRLGSSPVAWRRGAPSVLTARAWTSIARARRPARETAVAEPAV